MFRHFLVTRFNLRVDSWHQTKNGEAVLTEDWLEKRFYLFENFCLPSVRNQDNQHFLWCIYLDENTPVSYQERISALTKEYINIRIFYINGAEALNSSLVSFIKAQVDSDDKYIITTRLDNDDMIHQDFIAVIQSLFVPADKCVIDMQNGYQLCIESDFAELRNYKNRFNPFISVIENLSGFETVFSKPHFEWSQVSNTIEYKDSNLWCEIIHDTNKLNVTKKGIHKKYHFNAQVFGLNNGLICLEPAFKIFVFNFKISLKGFSYALISRINKKK
jgi:Putative rhamnosyl transferase